MAIAMKPIKYDDLNAVNHVNVDCSLSYAIEADLVKSGITIIDGYLGANFDFVKNYNDIETINTLDYKKNIEDEIEEYIEVNKYDHSKSFARLYDKDIESLIDVEAIKVKINETCCKNIIIYNYGSSSKEIREMADRVIYIDVTPKDLGIKIYDDKVITISENENLTLNEKIRRAYFIDTEVTHKLRKELFNLDLINYYCIQDYNNKIKIVKYEEFINIINELIKKPFRAKPVYLDGVWGGQFIKKVRNISDEVSVRIAWSFELIPYESSVQVSVNKNLLDFPFYTMMDKIGNKIIGDELYERFDGLFPVRFNYDDTWHSDGNMSIQSHPSAEMVKEMYNDKREQSEAYYVIDASFDAKTYIGYKGDLNELLEKCEDGNDFNYQDYINYVDSTPGTQVMIPAGTIHASGRNQVVLELGTANISAYTYKLYDYNRLGGDGEKRPKHLELGKDSLLEERNEEWVSNNSIMQPIVISDSDNYVEKIVGDCDLMYFQTLQIDLKTKCSYSGINNGLTVISLVNGEKATVRDKNNHQHAYDLNYLDIVVVPDSINEYEIIGKSEQPLTFHKTIIKGIE